MAPNLKICFLTDMKKVKRQIGIISIISFFMLIGTVGGIEMESISLLDGSILSVVYLSIFGLSVAAANTINEMTQRNRQRIPYKQQEERKAA